MRPVVTTVLTWHLLSLSSSVIMWSIVPDSVFHSIFLKRRQLWIMINDHIFILKVLEQHYPRFLQTRSFLWDCVRYPFAAAVISALSYCYCLLWKTPIFYIFLKVFNFSCLSEICIARKRNTSIVLFDDNGKESCKLPFPSCLIVFLS